MTKQSSMSVSDARVALSKLAEQLNTEERSGEVVAITKSGKPVLALLSWETYELLAETLEILSDGEAMAQFHQAVKELQAGRKGVAWKDLQEQVLRGPLPRSWMPNHKEPVPGSL